MNRGQFNGYLVNGPVADPVVRIRVDAKGYARARAGGRVFAYAVAHAQPRARLLGQLGRVEGHLSASGMARAAVAGALGHVDVRSLLAVTGRAILHVTLPPVRSRVAARAAAKTTLKARALLRSSVAATGQAKFAPKTRRLPRGPVTARPTAAIQADGTVYVRRWLRSPLAGGGSTYIVSRHHIEARLAALVQAGAEGAVAGHVRARAPLHSQAVAFIEIDPAVHKRLPFDEPAPETRTFRVPETMTTFYVTDQGTSMFRVSPPMQPADTQDYDIEFDGWFPPGDEIVSVALAVQPAMPMPPSYAFQAQRVKVWVYAGGASGQKYQISIAATTNDGRVKEVELVVPIKEV